MKLVKDMGLLGNKVCELSFSDDGNKIVAVGEGAVGCRSNAFTVSNGTKAGDVTGATDNVQTCFMAGN